MIKRTIEISHNAAHLATRDEQLLILRESGAGASRSRIGAERIAGSVPCEDIGVVMVDQRETTYSHSALVKLAEYGAALVICGRDHQPVGMYLPMSENSQVVARIDIQLEASKPIRKRLWSQIVIAKILAQAAILADDGQSTSVKRALVVLARKVRSGDPENVEAQAAVRYWPALFQGVDGIEVPFRRRYGDPRAAPPNNLLDYGYAAVRAAVSRAIVSAGLLPVLGIKHRGRSNYYCLSDDLMEPLRPLIDRRVVRLARDGHFSLDRSTKGELLQVLTESVALGSQTGPLLVAIVRYVASFTRVLSGEDAVLQIPTMLGARRL